MLPLKIIVKPKLKIEKQYNCQINKNAKFPDEGNQYFFNEYNLNALENNTWSSFRDRGTWIGTRERVQQDRSGQEEV